MNRRGRLFYLFAANGTLVAAIQTQAAIDEYGGKHYYLEKDFLKLSGEL